jgi:hypothetical protein
LHPALAQTEHRPWPLPRGAWTWRQSWCDLLFAHWPIEASALARHIPPGLELQELDGSAWVGVVPFRMQGVMRRPLPDLPWVSAFPELNVRTYVERDGRPGVWFLSLDASNALAVWAARRFFFLPYFKAEMTARRERDTIVYSSSRAGACFRARYRPSSSVYCASSGSLEAALTERYCLYARRADGALLRNEVHHAPWPLQRAELELDVNGMLEVHGLRVSGAPPLLHFAERLDVVVWPAERCA